MMPNTKICKICGKEYKYCKTESLKDIFRWRDVACCPEHGKEYFRQIMESRSESETNFVAKTTEKKSVKAAKTNSADKSE